MIENKGKKGEGQAGFRPNRNCVGFVYTLGRMFQGRKDAGLTTYLSLIHI